MAVYDLATQTITSGIKPGDIINCSYCGEGKSVTLPKGYYKLEVWGAQGGTTRLGTGIGGKGGYSIGFLSLKTPTLVYLYTGQVGGTAEGGSNSRAAFNGGGIGRCNGFGEEYQGSGGGGASDIRINEDSLYARVIVAGGGGGGSIDNGGIFEGGYGGGLTGGGFEDNVATQTHGGAAHEYTTAGTFGNGGSLYIEGTQSGGGGGWYGGGSLDANNYEANTGGGSGYVYNSSSASDYPSGCLLDSSYYLERSSTIQGDEEFPSTSGGYEIGHSGDGYCRITCLKPLNIFTKIGGAPKKFYDGFTKINGAWKKVKNLYCKIIVSTPEHYKETLKSTRSYELESTWEEGNPEEGSSHTYSDNHNVGGYKSAIFNSSEGNWTLGSYGTYSASSLYDSGDKVYTGVNNHILSYQKCTSYSPEDSFVKWDPIPPFNDYIDEETYQSLPHSLPAITESDVGRTYTIGTGSLGSRKASHYECVLDEIPESSTIKDFTITAIEKYESISGYPNYSFDESTGEYVTSGTLQTYSAKSESGTYNIHTTTDNQRTSNNVVVVKGSSCNVTENIYESEADSWKTESMWYPPIMSRYIEELKSTREYDIGQSWTEGDPIVTPNDYSSSSMPYIDPVIGTSAVFDSSNGTWTISGPMNSVSYSDAYNNRDSINYYTSNSNHTLIRKRISSYSATSTYKWGSGTTGSSESGYPEPHGGSLPDPSSKFSSTGYYVENGTHTESKTTPQPLGKDDFYTTPCGQTIYEGESAVCNGATYYVRRSSSPSTTYVVDITIDVTYYDYIHYPCNSTTTYSGVVQTITITATESQSSSISGYTGYNFDENTGIYSTSGSLVEYSIRSPSGTYTIHTIENNERKTSILEIDQGTKCHVIENIYQSKENG